MAAEPELNGRAVGVDTNLGDCMARVDFKWSADDSNAVGVASGLLVRVVDNKNFLAALVLNNVDEGIVTALAYLVIGGKLDSQLGGFSQLSPTSWSTISVTVVGDQFQVGVGPLDAPEVVISHQFTKLGTTLATGDVYIYDENEGVKAVTREYDNPAAWSVSSDAACSAARSIESRSDGVYRQVSGEDDVWGQVVPEGFLPYASPSGLEERATRGIVIASQGDLDQLPDSGSNKLSAQVFYRPAYLFSRDAAA